MVKATFKTIYPYANVVYELYLLSYNVRYLFDKTPYWRPWLSWMGVEVRRMSPDDYVRFPFFSFFSFADDLYNTARSSQDYCVITLLAYTTSFAHRSPPHNSNYNQKIPRSNSTPLLRSSQVPPPNLNLLLPILGMVVLIRRRLFPST